MQHMHCSVYQVDLYGERDHLDSTNPDAHHTLTAVTFTKKSLEV